MRRLAPWTLCAAGTLAACAAPHPRPHAEPVARVDTVVITRDVPVAPAPGRARMLCLANGQNVEIRITAEGDTLVGSRLLSLHDLGPHLHFVGVYARAAPWFATDEPIIFQDRRFDRFGAPASRDCREIRIVGAFHGVNLFADLDAQPPFQILYVPVSPGIFQPFRAQVGRVRG